MSTHSLDNQMDERLVNKVAELERQLREIRTLQAQGQDAINVQVSDYYWFDLVLNNNQGGYMTFTFDNPEAARVFATFEYTAGQFVSLDLYDTIGTPSNNLADLWDIWHYTSANLSTDSTIKERILLRNRTGSTQTVRVFGRWRYVINSGSGSVA